MVIYCIMTKHFHVLWRCPRNRSECTLMPKRLVKFKCPYNPEACAQIYWQCKNLRHPSSNLKARHCAVILPQIWDANFFMKVSSNASAAGTTATQAQGHTWTIQEHHVGGERQGAGDYGDLHQDKPCSWILPFSRIMTNYRDKKLNWSLKTRDPKKLTLSFWNRLFNKD